MPLKAPSKCKAITSLETGTSVSSSGASRQTTTAKTAQKAVCQALRGIVPTAVASRLTGNVNFRIRGSGTYGVSQQVKQMNADLQQSMRSLVEEEPEFFFDKNPVSGQRRLACKKQIWHGGTTPEAKQLENLGHQLQEADSSLQDALASHLKWNPIPEERQLPKPTVKQRSAAQKRAEAQRPTEIRSSGIRSSDLQAIDAGTMDEKEVFARIGNAHTRVFTKLDFHRARDDSKSKFAAPVEERFMCKDPHSGVEVVDVWKLQMTASQKRLHPDDNCKDSDASPPHSPNRSTEEVRRRQGLGPREESMTALRMNQIEHARRIDRAQKQSRNQKLNWRIEHLLSIEHKAVRKEVATRDRMLFTWVALAQATDTFFALLALIKQRQEEMESPAPVKTRKIVRGPDGTLRHTKLEPPSPSPSSLRPTPSPTPSMTRSRSGRQLNIIESAIQKKIKEEEEAYERRKRNARWMVASNVGVATWCFKKPIQQVKSVEIIKDFISQAWRGYSIRSSVRNFIRRVRLIQRAFRISLCIVHHIRDHVYGPAYWEAETTLLAEIVGMAPKDLEMEVEKYMESCSLARYKAEVRVLLHKRAAFLKADSGQLLEIQREGTLHQRRTALLSALNVAPSHKMPLPPSGRLKQALGEHPREEVALTAKEHKQKTMMESMNTYRTRPEDRERILTEAYRLSLERWSGLHDKYIQRKHCFKAEWTQWRVEIMALGPGNREMWPPLPQFPQFPYELMRIDKVWLRREIFRVLKQRTDAMLSSSK